MCRTRTYIFLYFFVYNTFQYLLQTSRINSLFTFKNVLNLKFCIKYSYRVFFGFILTQKFSINRLKLTLSTAKESTNYTIV